MRHAAIACLVTLLAAALWGAPAAADEAQYEEAYSRAEPLPADGKVYLTNISGDVRIKTWTRNEVKIDAMKRSTAASAGSARKNADRITIDVRREDGRLKIETKYPEGRIVLRKFNVSVDYTLTVPAEASVTVNIVSGDIIAGNMAGRAKLTSVSGSIRAEKLTGGGEFTSVSGNIDLKDIRGNAEASDVSGSITLSDVSGAVEVETVSGSVTADYLYDAESVDIAVHSGDIVYEGGVNPDGSYSFATHSGSITVTLPPDAAFDFECESFSGHIESDFRVASETTGKAKQREMTYNALRGTVNGGGADVTIETFSGSIELRKNGEREREGSRTRSQHPDGDDD